MPGKCRVRDANGVKAAYMGIVLMAFSEQRSLVTLGLLFLH